MFHTNTPFEYQQTEIYAYSDIVSIFAVYLNLFLPYQKGAGTTTDTEQWIR